MERDHITDGGCSMICLCFALAVCFLLMPLPALCQDSASTTETTPTLSPGELKATPEMWFYEQSLRQYLDPKMAVRAKAEFQTEQRQRRLAARRWFGFSNARPRMSSDPYHWNQSPCWASNNYAFPYLWQGVGGPYYVVQPHHTTVHRY